VRRHWQTTLDASRTGEEGTPSIRMRALLATFALLLLAAAVGAPAAGAVEPAAGTCPNEAFRVGFSAHLPDCRAYELVNTGSNNAALQQTNGVASADGTIFEYTATDATDDSPSSSASNVVVQRRGPTGWAGRQLGGPLVSPITGYYHESVAAVSRDFTEFTFVSDQELLGPATPPGAFNLYLHRADGTIVPMTNRGGVGLPGVAWASADFRHIFFQTCAGPQMAEDPLPNECPGTTYEWSQSGGIELIGRAPDGTPLPAGGVLVGTPPGPADGRFHTYNEGTQSGVSGGPLYMRMNGGPAVDVSATQRTIEPDPNPAASPAPVGVTDDGSKIFFVSASELTNDAYTGRTGGVANDLGADLYSYDVASGKLTDLTVDTEPVDAERGAAVRRVQGFSKDGSYIYFTALGVLAPGAVSGEENFYVEHDGQITLIGVDAGPNSTYVTPDGRHAAFLSRAPLTGYDNVNPNTLNPEPEAFEFTYGNGLACASCRPDGRPPTGPASFMLGAFPFAANGPARTLTDDGSRMFFNSSDAILPKASNGLQNVYEYEGGDVHLISPGDGDYPATLVAASASGDDVFIVQRGELLGGGGPGTVAAIYDARVGATPTPTVVSEPCRGESCQGGGSSPPGLRVPGSANVHSPSPIRVAKVKPTAAAKVRLRVTVAEAGKIRVTGHGLRAVSRGAPGPGAYNLTVRLSSEGNKSRHRKGRFVTNARVSFESGPGIVSAGSRLEFVIAGHKGGK
jgi:hypothetical protein